MQSCQNLCFNCSNFINARQMYLSDSLQEECTSTKIYIKCLACKSTHCRQCFKEHQSAVHSQQQNQDLQWAILCQECQTQVSSKYCQNCGQNLCHQCSFRIHNKGKRAKHCVSDNKNLQKVKTIHFLSMKSITEIQLLNKIDSESVFICLKTAESSEASFRDRFKIQQSHLFLIEDGEKLEMEDVEGWLNQFPMISELHLNQGFQTVREKIQTIKSNQSCQDSKDLNYVWVGDCKIQIKSSGEVLESQMKQTNACNNKKQTQQSEKSELQRQKADSPIVQDSTANEEDNFPDVEIKDFVIERSFEKQSKSNTEKSQSSEKHKDLPNNANLKRHLKNFKKKDSADFSNQENRCCLPIQTSSELIFKKSCKASNRSLVIEIPESKKYKESPIKSDREQGFEVRGDVSEVEASKKDKTQIIHMDSNDYSDDNSQLFEQNSLNEASILMAGSERDTSFQLIDNETSLDESNAKQNSQKTLKNVNVQLPISMSTLNIVNLSSSTDNSIPKRSKKLPVPYFHPFKSKYSEGLNNSYGGLELEKTRFKTEKKLRQLCQKGVLMVTRDKATELGIRIDDKICRKVKKTVCEKELQFFALQLDTLSIESIIWVLESIKEDKMMPSEKLVLSRLKESFNIKPASRLWSCIVKYLESTQYLADKKQYDSKYRYLPTISVGKVNEQVLLEYRDKWQYEDQEILDWTMYDTEWEAFKIVLNDYFKNNKQITGGRYGCVQYVRLNGPKVLQKCSLGRLSYYVQQAINKGLIRYHKTLLIQNLDCSEESSKVKKEDFELQNLQKELKILIVQTALVDILLEAGCQTEVSLAQIPLTFKKNILFEVNLLELGFPKLKNVLQKITDKLVLSSSKSHIKYQEIKSSKAIEDMRIRVQQIRSFLISEISSAVSSIMLNRHNINAEELLHLTNEKLGFELDFRVCNVPDFYQFLIYYCHQIINMQFINGSFVAFPKHLGFQQFAQQTNIPYQPTYPYQQQYQPYPFQNSGHQPEYGGYQQPIGYPPNIPYSQHYPGSPTFNEHNSGFQHFSCNQGFYNPQHNSPRGSTFQQQFASNNTYGQSAPYNSPSMYARGLNSPKNFMNNGGSSGQMRSPKGLNQPNIFPENNPYSQYQSGLHTNPHLCNIQNHPSQNYFPSKANSKQTVLTPQVSEISTPKFNESVQYLKEKQIPARIKDIDSVKWESYLDAGSNFEESEDFDVEVKPQSESYSDYQSIYKILDDNDSESRSKFSHPKTFIEKEGSSCNNNQGELYISKITPIDEKSDHDEEGDGSLEFFDDSPGKEHGISVLKSSKKKKPDHNRVHSTAEARTKHERMYSTTTAKN